MKLTTFFISRTKHIYAKILTVPESTFKINVTSDWTLFKLLLTSAVISEQKPLHENKIVQYLQKYKY